MLVASLFKLRAFGPRQSSTKRSVISADTWDAAVKSINSDETFHFLVPRCAVFNGRTVTINSCGEHPIGFKPEDDGSLVSGKSWSG